MHTAVFIKTLVNLKLVREYIRNTIVSYEKNNYVHYDKVESDRETGIYFSETSIVKNFRHKICSLEIPEKFPPTFPL